MKAILIISIMFLSACSTIQKEHTTGTDFHMHIHTPPEEYDDMQFNADRALFAADSIGLKRAVVLSNAYSKNVSEAYAVKENNFVQAESAKNKTKLAGACAVNPSKNWAWREIKRCSSNGVKVLKLHFMASGMNLTKSADYKIAQDVVKEAEINKLTILVHANYPKNSRPGEIEKLKQLIEEFPNTRWIIGHFFGREFEVLKGLTHPNFFVEISITPIWTKSPEDRTNLVQTMREVGIKKFIFGSDWPVIHPAETLKAFQALPLNEKEQNMVLFTNASQLNDLFD